MDCTYLCATHPIIQLHIATCQTLLSSFLNTFEFLIGVIGGCTQILLIKLLYAFSLRFFLV